MPARQEPHDFFPCNLREATPTSLGIGAFSPSPASTHLMFAMTGRASAPTLSFPKWFLKSGAHVCPANLYLAPRVISTPIIVLLPHSFALSIRFWVAWWATGTGPPHVSRERVPGVPCFRMLLFQYLPPPEVPYKGLRPCPP